MVSFKNTIVNLGDVAINTKHDIIYEFTGDASEISSVNATCGCTASVKKESDKITAVFTVTNTGEFTKTINVFFTNKSVLNLSIKGNGFTNTATS